MFSIRILCALVCLLLLHASVKAQLTDNFADGNYTANPAWQGSPASWQVNAANQLQSNNTTANTSFYISTQSNLAQAASWQFSLQLKFNTSSANYVDVYLTASAENLLLPTTTGYFVRIGGTDDEVALYQKNSDGKSIKLIDGANGITNSSDNNIKIKVTRTANNEFTLWRTDKATGQLIKEGSSINHTYTTSAYFGFIVKQSTVSFFGKHNFDDVIVQPFYTDTISPVLTTATATSATTLNAFFSEPIDSVSAVNSSNYFASHDIGQPKAAWVDGANKALVHLTFGKPFPNSDSISLTTKNIADNSGNISAQQQLYFSFYNPQRYDIIIDELMADPSPSQGLPNAEYIELKNISGRPINLEGWKLSTYTATSHALPKYMLQPNAFVIITTASAAPLFSGYGSVLGITNFPALYNDSSTIFLHAANNNIIHAINYSTTTFGNVVKAEGGWSLEMKDTRFPCTGSSNWAWSNNSKGGTPGTTNSVDGHFADGVAPQLLNAHIESDKSILLTFSETLDSAKAANNKLYTLLPALHVESAAPIGPLFKQVRLYVSAPLLPSSVHTLYVNGVTDCAGNQISNNTSLKIGIPQPAASKDVVINEILFNPKPSCTDYVELYNRSKKVIDVANLYIANRNSSGVISSVKKLFQNPLYLFPDEYMVFTEDVDGLLKTYLVKNSKAVVKVATLPSMPDKEGTVMILNAAGDVIDEVAYNANWHFALISNPEGVALERISPDGESNDKNNWHSAAATAGYGTPTYKNSQQNGVANSNAAINVIPKVFSPDNDGIDDAATIQYNLSEGGYVANIYVFDAVGKTIRHLVKNELLGQKGSWKWDGLDEKGLTLPVGNYIIYTEVMNRKGQKQLFKNTVVLARRF